MTMEPLVSFSKWSLLVVSRAALWKGNGYISCKLMSDGSEEDSDEEKDDDNSTDPVDISYVRGDVTHPVSVPQTDQNFVIHCIGKLLISDSLWLYEERWGEVGYRRGFGLHNVLQGCQWNTNHVKRCCDSSRKWTNNFVVVGSSLTFTATYFWLLSSLFHACWGYVRSMVPEVPRSTSALLSVPVSLHPPGWHWASTYLVLITSNLQLLCQMGVRPC